MPVVEIHGPHHHADDWRAEHVATLLISEQSAGFGTHFHTHPAEPLQVAATRYPAGHKVPAHAHPPRSRPAFNGRTQEVIVVKRGQLLCHFWDSDGGYAGQWMLRPGDAAIFVGGAHSFEALEEVELTEVKQGPWVEGADKVLLEGSRVGLEPYQELERRWAAFNDLDPTGMVACSTGTSALTLALRSMRLPRRSPVIQPEFSMIATALATVNNGLEPVFVDCTPDLLMDPAPAEQWLRWQEEDGSALIRASALLVVHVYGRQANMVEFNRLAQVHDLRLIEDLAETHGVRPHHATDAACWSFQSSKVVHGEEGGAVWFRDPAHAAHARLLRHMGFDAVGGDDYDHIPDGDNYRLSNAHAGMILDSLDRVRENLTRRREAEAAYDAHCPPEWRMPPRTSPWCYDLRVPGLTRQRQSLIVRALRAAGVAARMSFKPMTMQRQFRERRRVLKWCCDAHRAADEVFYLPLLPERVRPGDAQLAFAVICDVLAGKLP